LLSNWQHFIVRKSSESFCSLKSSHWLIHSILDQNSDIRTTETISFFSKILKLSLSNAVFVFFKSFLQHSISGLFLWKRYINSPFKSSSNGWIQIPWKICRSQNQNSLIILSNSLHLHKKFCLYSS